MGFGPTAATVIATDLTPPRRGGARRWASTVWRRRSALAVGPYAGGELVRPPRLRVDVPRGDRASRPSRLALGVDAAGDATGGRILHAGSIGARTGRRARAGRARAVLAALVQHRRRSYPRRSSWRSTSRTAASPRSCRSSRSGASSGTPGLFYTVYALVSLAVRSPAGRLSDRLGRRAVIAPALGHPAAGLAAVLGLAASQRAFLGAAALYGVGFGAAQPALLAMTADRAPPGERGRAMGTLYTAWELGISGGAMLLGLCATTLGYEATWWTAAVIAAAGRARGALA